MHGSKPESAFNAGDHIRAGIAGRQPPVKRILEQMCQHF